MMMVGKLIRHR